MNHPTESGDILYVHPRHLHYGRDNQIPMGAIGLANALGPGVRGLFAVELTDRDLHDARVLLMDVHWYFGLDSAIRIAERARRVNPAVRIVVGGYTASIFALDLLKRSAVDYVVRGDAEGPLPELVAALREGGDPSRVPNVAGRDFTAPLSYHLRREDYDRVDYLDIGWFPTLERMATRTHRVPYPTWIYPFIPVFKGCKYPCEYCLGNPSAQRLICGRGIVSRSPERVVQDLAEVESRRSLRRAYIIADFLDILEPAYADAVLSRRFAIDLYFEFYRIPAPDAVRTLAACFRRLYLGLFLTQNHGAVQETRLQISRLREALRAARETGADVALNLHMGILRDRPADCGALASVFRQHPGLSLVDSSLWDLPCPPAEHIAAPSPGSFDAFRRRSALKPLWWRMREGLVSIFFRGPQRHRALFRLNSLRLALALRIRSLRRTRATDRKT